MNNKHDLLVDMPYVVLHILLKHKVLRAWCNNTISSKPPFRYFVDLAVIRKQPEKWLDYAFFWSDTPEGEQFWYDIYKEIVNKTKYG